MVVGRCKVARAAQDCQEKKNSCCQTDSTKRVILDVRLVDVPAGVTQEEGRAGFLHLPSAVLALLFIARRRIQPSLSLVDREVKFCVCMVITYSRVPSN